MLVLLRAESGFLPFASRPGVRRVHYNSLWVPGQHRGAFWKAASEEETSSSTSTDSDDPWAEYRNKNNIEDQVVSAISKDGGIKVTACTNSQ
ncbi:expressed unknown protein [Seminavis robusta]|uniref:Uncharacterized protein n=1 Tax=Seminavis robusta TaxID=568900 RepID=A0A9N8E3R7_9STRA|nr:expressed unknown protein [Seminavis robusta]|eukprot:Sro472_g149820.1 n/a (92) ;mRNA; f:2204-2479